MVPANQAEEAKKILDDYHAGRLMDHDDQPPEES
jgi:hypothetical protein